MSNAIKELEELYLQKQMFLNPDHSIESIRIPKFGPVDNVSLSKCVTAYFELNGYVTNKRNIISIHFGLVRRNSDFMLFVYNDKAIYIHVNFHKLELDEYQLKLKKSIQETNAFYYSVTSFNDFVKWFKLNLLEEREATHV